jgi:hypothetical protein
MKLSVLAANVPGHESSPGLVSFYVGFVFPNAVTHAIEILALRPQLAVLQRQTKNRPILRAADRFLWVLLSRFGRSGAQR